MTKLKEQQRELQQAYLREWQADEEDPITVIQDIGIHMLMETEEALQRLMSVHKQRYFNRMSYQRRYAQPFVSALQILPSPSFQGAFLQKDTRFYIQSASLLAIRLKEDILIQHTCMKEAFLVNPKTNHIVHIPCCENVPLFSYDDENIQTYAFMFTLKNMFTCCKHPQCDVYFETDKEESTALYAWLSSASVKWKICWEEKEVCWEMKQKEDHLCFSFQEDFSLSQGKLTFTLKHCDMRNVPEFHIDLVYVRIAKASSYLDSVRVQEIEEQPSDFSLTDSPISLFQTCYLRCDEVFSRLGAQLTWKFSMDVQVRTMGKELIEEMDYHLFMRRLPKQQIVYDVYLDSVVMEYFNGEWVKLKDVHFSRDFFHQSKEDCELTFQCPSDMRPYSYDGMKSYWFRFMVTKADHCYLLPSHHHIPRIKHSHWSFDYGDTRILPEEMQLMYNAASEKIETGFPFTLFPPMQEEKETMYLRLNQKPLKGACRMYVEMQHSYDQLQHMQFLLDTKQGKTALAVEDGTDGFAHSGLLSMFFLSHMEKVTRFGISSYWLQIQNEETSLLFNRIRSLKENCVYAYADDTYVVEKSVDVRELPTCIHLDDDVRSVEMKIEDEWHAGILHTHGKCKELEVLYDEEEHTLTIYRETLPYLVKEKSIRLRLSCQKALIKEFLPVNTTVFPAQSMQKVAAIHTLHPYVWQREKESDQKLLHRLSKQKTQGGCIQNERDMEETLMEQFPDLHDVKCHHDKEEITLIVVWEDDHLITQSQGRKQQLLSCLKKRLSDSFSFPIAILAPQRVDFYIRMEIEHEDMDIDRHIEKLVQNYLDPIHGRHENGWHIGEYCTVEELVDILKETLRDVVVIDCDIKVKFVEKCQQKVVCVDAIRHMEYGMMYLADIHIQRERLSS